MPQSHLLHIFTDSKSNKKPFSGRKWDESLSLTFFCISGGTTIGGSDPRQAVGPVEGAGTGGQSGARVRRGGGSAGCGNGRGRRRRPVALLNKRWSKGQCSQTLGVKIH